MSANEKQVGANDYQVGGRHYEREYQHWDWVCDIQLHYLLGCASKYVVRHRHKNGEEDLRKALHYLDKALERGVLAVQDLEHAWRLTDKFTAGMPELEARAIKHMISNGFNQAKVAIADLLEQTMRARH